MVIQRVCEAVDIECHWTGQEECGEETAEVWLSLFAEALAEQLESISE